MSAIIIYHQDYYIFYKDVSVVKNSVQFNVHIHGKPND